MDDVEEKMRRMFVAGESWWPQVALVSLVQGEPSLGYEWAERCVRRLLPRVETPIRQQLLADLNVLSEMRVRGATQEEFWRWSEEIWYRQPPGGTPLRWPCRSWSGRQVLNPASAQTSGI